MSMAKRRIQRTHARPRPRVNPNMVSVDIWMCSDGGGHFFRPGADTPSCGASVTKTGADPPEDRNAQFLCGRCVECHAAPWVKRREH